MIRRDKFMRQCSPLRVECVVERIFQEVDEWRCVDVGKTIQTPREICWIVVRSEQAAETLVKQLLHHLPRYMHTHAHARCFYLVWNENLVKQKRQHSLFYLAVLASDLETALSCMWCLYVVHCKSVLAAQNCR